MNRKSKEKLKREIITDLEYLFNISDSEHDQKDIKRKIKKWKNYE